MEGVGTTRPPELHIASRPKKPSDWTPRPIPQPGPERRTADPKTPTARELAERARQRASVVAKADATRVEKHAVATPPAASTPDVRPHRETALDRDPLGRDRLTAVEQRRLGELCQRGDCSPVQVDRGTGTPTANNLRADILTTRQGRSVTLGNRIVLADTDTNDFAILAHDVQHTLQYR